MKLTAHLPLALLLSLFLTACGQGGREGFSSPDVSSRAAPKVVVLSNRADLISGGDALVEIVLDAGQSASGLRVSLNGADISSSFARRENGRVMGRVEGLVVGENTLLASLPGAGEGQAQIRNYPNEGPIFSRPEIKRVSCQEGAVDMFCNKPAEYTYLYRPTAPLQDALGDVLDDAVVQLGVELMPYDPANPPDDVAMTTTQNGQTVPFIVRQELGYQDRDQYKILTLFDPDAPWEPWAPQPQWNGKMLITHGGNCGAKYRPSSAPLADYSGTF
ncbi:MAG: DUF6351 family protein, partial [Oceanococcaceae bacterium]